MEGIGSMFLVGVEGPRFTSIQQCANPAGMVHFQLGGNGQHGVIPDPLYKVSH